MRLALALLFVFVQVVQAADTELPVEIQSVLNLRNVPTDTLSVFVADVESGKTVLSWRADEARNPAFLVTERVWKLLKTIQSAGVRDITGDLLLDDSWFDVGNYDPSAFDKQPLRAYNVAPNALLMNFKVVRYWFTPDHAADAVDVKIDPPLDNLQVDNRLGLAVGVCRGGSRKKNDGRYNDKGNIGERPSNRMNSSPLDQPSDPFGNREINQTEDKSREQDDKTETAQIFLIHLYSYLT